jgi:hypothetical protein
MQKYEKPVKPKNKFMVNPTKLDSTPTIGDIQNRSFKLLKTFF